MPKIEARSEVSGLVWKVETAMGQRVTQGDTLILIESMKMEIPIIADVDGLVVSISVKEGDAISEGTIVAILEC